MTLPSSSTELANARINWREERARREAADDLLHLLKNRAHLPEDAATTDIERPYSLCYGMGMPSVAILRPR